jgi:prephenate dehydratase
MKIAFQGERGAYSEEATLKFFKDQTVEPIGFELSEEVVDALLQKEAHYAVLPVENSIVGNVSVNLDLLYQADIFAIGEVYLPIHHHLLALPETKISDIKKVYSHPIALAQCRDYLNRHKIKAIADYDTAGSCKQLSHRQSKNEGAIGSKLCAQTYGLEIIEDNVQKLADNITRFLVLSRSDEITKGIKPNKTSIAFSSGHHPGALLDCLEIFKKFSVNLTKLESRPIPENPFEYIFFVDFLGGLEEKNVKDCLTELEKDAHHVKVLGSYTSGVR